MWKGVGGMWGVEKYFEVDHMMMNNNNKGSHDNDGQSWPLENTMMMFTSKGKPQENDDNIE
jgi:hypothetical protein